MMIRSAKAATLSLRRRCTRHAPGGCDGQIDHERRLGHAVALDVETTMMGVHDLARDGESEAGAPGLRREERLEDPFSQFSRDARAGIVHPDANTLLSPRFDPHIHLASGRRGLERI